MTATENITSTPLAEQITKIVAAGDVNLPPLPEVGQKLLELLRDTENVDMKQIAELIQNDPAITAALMKIANSAVFGGLQPVANVSQALARLGLRKVNTVVTTIVMKGHFDADNHQQQALLMELWKNAVATAIAARHLTSICGGDAEESYLAGLLQNVGKLLIIRAVDLLTQSGQTPELTPPVMAELLEVLHAELGYKVLQEWQLPESVCQVALRHHEDSEELQDNLIVRVQAADLITRKLGLHPNPDTELNLTNEPAIEMLGIGEVQLAALMIDLEDEIEQLLKLL